MFEGAEKLLKKCPNSPNTAKCPNFDSFHPLLTPLQFFSSLLNLLLTLDDMCGHFEYNKSIFYKNIILAAQF